MRPFTLSRDTFHILVALAGCDRHGYSILQEIAERTDGKVRLTPARSTAPSSGCWKRG